jgi:hypothetical protein
MIGPKRVRSFARPRQMAMYLCKQLTTRSLPEIGRKFGGRDHTTVMHGVRKIEELMPAQPDRRGSGNAAPRCSKPETAAQKVHARWRRRLDAAKGCKLRANTCAAGERE